MVGKSVISKFGHSKIPYLPKVLSIAKALPLQLHPNKELAAELHKKDPQNFTDPNHKPEIALALSKFEAFCGFKPLSTIEALLKLEPLKQFVPSGSFNDEALRSVVRNMLEAPEDTVKSAMEGLSKLQSSDFGKDTYIKELIPRLTEQYDQTDPGHLVALITMNYLVLQPNECLSIPADGIHAYLSGDIIECMARSNNVLNTGFCPTAERSSAELFCSCLTFKPHTPEDCTVAGEKFPNSKNGKTTLFRPPMSEFNMLVTKLESGDKDTLSPIDGPTMYIATSGDASMKANGQSFDMTEGTTWFIAPGVEVELESKKGALLHAAYADAST